MRKNLIWIMAVFFMVAACGKRTTSDKSGSKAEANYQKGYDCDRNMQHRMAEYYWKSSMAETANSKDAGDLEIYAKSASRLTNVLCVRGEYEAALDVAIPAAERLEQLKCDTTSDYTNLLIYIGCCQSRFGMSADEANQSYDRAYKMHIENIEKRRTNESFKNAIAGVINIAYNCNETHNFKEALQWTKRYGELISQYEQRGNNDDDYTDKQWARYDIYRAIALEGLNQKEEAAEAYEHFKKTRFSQTPNGRILAVDYLSVANRWGEAADCYESLDTLLTEHDAGYSLETLQKMVLKKYNANKMAGRTESASAVSLYISEHLDSAISKSRRLESEEQATIIKIEAKKAAEESREAETRQWIGYGVLAAIFALFGIFTYLRRRARLRIEKDYASLKTAYDQLEDNTRTEERALTEQQIAESMQSLVADYGLPRDKAFDIHVTMETAKTIGGDFYDAILRDGKLLFCIGDGSGKGLGASLNKTLAKSLFRTAIINEEQPDRIVSSINQALFGVGDESVSATLFVGLLDLSTGELRYCNANHPTPLLVGEELTQLPVDENLSVGVNSVWNYEAQEVTLAPGTLFFAYSDGLPMAENVNHELFEERRVMGEALQSLYGLESAPQPFIERMRATLQRFMGEAELTDDMTMLAIRYGKAPKNEQSAKPIK